MADTTDVIVSTLREMRAETKDGFERLERRLDRIEKAQVTFRHAMSADSLLSKLVTQHFASLLRHILILDMGERC